VSWLGAFLLTQAIELPIYVLGTRGTTLSLPWRLAIGLGASAVTHPVVWFVLRDHLSPVIGFPALFVLAETFAVVTEALYLRAFDVPRPWRLSLLANATSASVGLLLWWLQR
jgi:tetrahydromethanopterin S-methyltransferase subunit E